MSILTLISLFVSAIFGVVFGLFMTIYWMINVYADMNGISFHKALHKFLRTFSQRKHD